MSIAGDFKNLLNLFKQHFLGKSEVLHIETRRFTNGQWVLGLARGKSDLMG